MPCKPGATWGFALAIEPTPPLLVACLCAAWCNVCTDYRSRFEQVQATLTASHPDARFVWIDIEDDEALLHPLDVEDFPTLLIALGDTPYFFGPLTPQAQTLERMARNAMSATTAPGVTDPHVSAAVRRIRAEPQALR